MTAVTHPTAEVTIAAAVARAIRHRMDEGRRGPDAIADVVYPAADALGQLVAMAAKDRDLDACLAVIARHVAKAAHESRARQARRAGPPAGVRIPAPHTAAAEARRARRPWYAAGELERRTRR